MTAIPPTTEPAAPSAAAERTRRHRQRRRDGERAQLHSLSCGLSRKYGARIGQSICGQIVNPC
jgi:hypothetical protein